MFKGSEFTREESSRLQRSKGLKSSPGAWNESGRESPQLTVAGDRARAMGCRAL